MMKIIANFKVSKYLSIYRPCEFLKSILYDLRKKPSKKQLLFVFLAIGFSVQNLAFSRYLGKGPASSLFHQKPTYEPSTEEFSEATRECLETTSKKMSPINVCEAAMPSATSNSSAEKSPAQPDETQLYNMNESGEILSSSTTQNIKLIQTAKGICFAQSQICYEKCYEEPLDKLSEDGEPSVSVDISLFNLDEKCKSKIPAYMVELQEAEVSLFEELQKINASIAGSAN